MRTHQASRNPHQALRASAFCLLLSVFFALSLAQITTTSPTFDEGFTILRGYAALRTGYLIPIGHPPLAHWLSGLGVVLEPNLPDPRDLNGWYGDQYDDSSRDLLWQRGLNTQRVVLLARLPILFLALVLGALTARWTKDLFGWGAATVALALHALSPNLLAHSALATTDLPVAAFYVFTLYRWFRFAKVPTPLNAALTGLMVGCALSAKFSALLLLPTLGLLFLIHMVTTKALRHEDTKKISLRALVSLCLRGFLMLGTALVTIWAMYGFALTPFPLAQYVRELTDLQTLASEGHTAYLFGLLSAKGWWYYHLVVLLVKTPLPLLALIAVALIQGILSIIRHGLRVTHYVLMIPALATFLYLLAASLSSLNVGYRYLLPALPLLHVVAASAIGNWKLGFGSWHPRSLVIVSIFIVHLYSTLSIAPHFLAYFNEFVGPANGYKVLADSNLDWGQDLPSLARYLNGRPVFLSYFGRADPAYYGIRSDPLPGWPPPPETQFAPADPAPGLYAISASNLVGVQLFEPNTFAYFRELTPLTVINYSIFFYEVPEHEPVTTIAQCTPPILNKDAVANLLENRTIRQATFDCANSLLIPAGPSLILYPENQAPILDLGPPIFNWRRADGSTYYRLYRTPSTGVQLNAPTPIPPHDPTTQYLSLLDYTLTSDALTLRWLVTELAPPPVSIFVHFNWPDGALAEAYDALGVPADQWQTDDIIIQRHPISPDLPPGEYPIIVGLYSLADGTRYSEIPLTSYQK